MKRPVDIAPIAEELRKLVGELDDMHLDDAHERATVLAALCRLEDALSLLDKFQPR